MFNKLKKLFKSHETVGYQPEKSTNDSLPPPKNPNGKKKKIELTEKEKATAAGEPYIAITKIDVSERDINSGEMTFDWNDKFILNLVRAGYKGKDTDTEWDMVNRWYQTLCRNVALEIYEQYDADPDNRDRADMRVVRTKDIGNGRSEVS